MQNINNYNYNIKSKLKQILPDDLDENTNVYIAIYTIQKPTQHNNILKPFLQYLLYKYPQTYKIQNLSTFPLVNYNKTKDILPNANKLVNNITNQTIKHEGYLLNKNGLYIFYHLQNYEFKLDVIKKNNQFWWTLIDEICNHKKIINFPIHKNVSSLFLKNPYLIYLTKNNNNIEIPSVGYFGSSVEFVNFTASLGLRATPGKLFGPYYYLGDFKDSIRYGSWTSNYKNMFISKQKITDDNGRYNQGGLVRFALFLGKNYNITYHKNNSWNWLLKTLDTNNDKNVNINNLVKKKWKKNKFDWASKYDSLIISSVKYKNLSGYFNINTKYIVKSYDQQTPLSIHFIDMNTVKSTWDPYYNFYNIQ